MTKFIHIVSMLLLLLSVSRAKEQSVFDVTKFGAKNGGDIKQALASAWKKACTSVSPSKVLIPKGTFSLTPVTLEGPCKAAIEVQVQGILKALTGPGKMTEDGGWVTFQYIKDFTLSGRGTFDGQGAKAWGTCGNDFCKKLPINIRFDFITNGVVKDITSLNSNQFHVNVLGCKNFNFHGVTITAPESSPNTDGIHIGRSSGINITNSKIQTGDDCISIGAGSQQVSITNIFCGPGHGISIGSLGRYDKEEAVVGITVKDCILSNTDNGVRIKTWPASKPGSASKVHFENITMVNVKNPIIIDQNYCPWSECNSQAPSRVKLNDISFKNIKGTSATPVAIKLNCSKGTCQGVELVDINLKYNGKEGPAKSECNNVKPKISGVKNTLACN